MAALFQFSAQLDVVEYLAVKNDPEGAIFVTDRLLPAGEIDNTEASIAERNIAAEVMPNSSGPRWRIIPSMRRTVCSSGAAE